MFYLPPHSLGGFEQLRILWAYRLLCPLLLAHGGKSRFECLVSVILCKGLIPNPLWPGVSCTGWNKNRGERVDKGLRNSTLCAELQFDAALLMRSPSNICRTWFLGAVLITLNFLPKGARLPNPTGKYLHCPPSISGELLRVWCLVAFILAKLPHLARMEILLWKVKVQGNVCLMYLELVLNSSLHAVRSWDLWRRSLVATTVLLCHFYNCWAAANHVLKKKKKTPNKCCHFCRLFTS